MAKDNDWPGCSDHPEVTGLSPTGMHVQHVAMPDEQLTAADLAELQAVMREDAYSPVDHDGARLVAEHTRLPATPVHAASWEEFFGIALEDHELLGRDAVQYSGPTPPPAPNLFLGQVTLPEMGNITMAQAGLVQLPDHLQFQQDVPIRQEDDNGVPSAKYPSRPVSRRDRELIADDLFPNFADEELRGDESGAVLVEHKREVVDRYYRLRKRRGDANPRLICGGKVTYVIPLDEILPEPIGPRRRTIFDWAYGLKAADAMKLLDNCKSDLCDENKNNTKCRFHRYGSIHNLGQKDPRTGEVFVELSVVVVTFTCQCNEPPPPVEGPVTGPPDDNEDDGGNNDDR